MKAAYRRMQVVELYGPHGAGAAVYFVVPICNTDHVATKVLQRIPYKIPHKFAIRMPLFMGHVPRRQLLFVEPGMNSGFLQALRDALHGGFVIPVVAQEDVEFSRA